MESSKLFTIQKAASFLKVSEKTLRRWEAKGILVGVRTSGGHRRYTIDQLTFVKKNKKNLQAQFRIPVRIPDTTNEILLPLIAREAEAPATHIVQPEILEAPVALTTPSTHAEEPLQTASSIIFNEEMEKPRVTQITDVVIAQTMLKPENMKSAQVSQAYSTPSTTSILKEIYKQSPKTHRFALKSYAYAFAAIIVITATAYIFKGATGSNLLGKFAGNKVAQESISEENNVHSLSKEVAQVLAATSFNNLQFKVNTDAQFTQDVAVNGGDITSSASNFNLLNTNVTSLQIGGEASSVAIGSSEGTTTIENSLLHLSGNTLTSSGDLAIKPEGGGVIIGTGTAGNVDLTGDDLLVSGDLEVNGTSYIPTLTIGGDTFTDLTGTGLAVSSGILNTTLGTTIESSEISDDTIKEVDLNVTNSGTNGYALTYNSSSGGFTWTDLSSALSGAGWTDNGTVVSTTTSTDNVTIGSTTELAKLAIDGDTDEIQLLVQGNATQTSNLFTLEQSDGTDVFSVTNAGNLTVGGTITLGGNTIDDFTGNGLTTSSNDLTIALVTATDGLSSTITNGSGLEVLSSGLTLLQGCATGQVLKWNETNDSWECANDTGATAAVINVENNDVAVGTNVDTIDFSTDFLLTASPSNEDNISIADDILNFSEFSDSLTLDASTSIAFGAGALNLTFTNNGSGNEIHNLSSTGDLTIQDNGTIFATFDDTGGITFAPNGTSDFTVTTDSDSTLTISGLSSGSGSALCLDGSNNLVTCTTGAGGIAGSGTSGQIAFFNGSTSITSESTGFSWDATNNKLGLGTDSPTGVLTVTGAAIGKALAIFNETGDQNIISASASGTTKFNVTRTGFLNVAAAGGLDTLAAGALNIGTANATSAVIGNSALTSLTVTTDGTGDGEVVLPGNSIGNAELVNSAITFAGDSGSSATSLGGTRTIAGGTNGIDTTESGGTVTLNLDTTEIGTTTFGSGSAITWTFDASGGTDTTIAFGNNTQTFTTGTATFSGDVTIQGGDITLNTAGTIIPSAAGTITIGNSNLQSLTVTTDSTGDSEVVLPGQSVSASEILNDTITATQLSSTLTFADGDLIDFSAINNSGTGEGVRLPQATACSSGTSNGQICWDNDTFALYVGNGSGVTLVGGSGAGDITAVGSMTSGDAFADSTADDDWLGLGSAAGRIEFDDQTVDEVNILAAKLGIGTSTPTSLFHVTGAITGKAMAIFDETGDQNIITASASGTTVANLDRSGNLAIEGAVSDLTDGTVNINDDLQVTGNDILDSGAATRITLGATTTLTNTTTTLSGTTTLTAASLATFTTAATLGMASTTTLNCGDCIDFDDMKDAMTLDASTSIGFGAGALNLTFTNDGSGNEIHNLSSTGDFIIQDNSTAFLTFKDDSTTDWVLPVAGDVAIDASTTASTVTTGVFDLNVNAGDAAVIGFNNDFIQNNGATTGRDAIAESINLSANDADGDVFGIKITGNATANAAAGSYEAGITIDNAEDTAASMTDAILITSSGINNGVTDALDVSAANINNGINLGANFLLFDGIRAFEGTTGTLTLEDTSGNDFITLADNGTSGTLAFTNTGFLDLAAITQASSANQGFRLPQNTTLTNPTSGEGYLAYDSDDDQVKVYNGSAWTSISGASTTLQEAYNNDGDTGDTIIALTTNDDSLIFRNPASGGSDSGYVLSLDQLATGAVDAMQVTQAGTGVGASFAFSNSGTTANGIIISNSAGTLTDAIDISDATGITNAINVGPNTILGTTANIDLNNFDVTGSNGNVVTAGDVAVNGGDVTTTSTTFNITVGNTGTISFTDGSNTLASLVDDGTSGKLGIGQTPVAKLDVYGAVVGKALVSFDERGDQNILTASASGTTVANLDRSGNLAIEGAISDLSGATLNVNDDVLIQGGDLTLGQNGADGTLTIYNELGGTDRSVVFQTSASQTQDTTYTLPVDDGSSNFVLVTDGSGVLSWASVSGIGGVGDITAVGSMTSGDAFSDSTADDDWLGLGSAAGRIEFDDQSLDEVNVLSAKLGVGTSTPTSLFHLDGTVTGKALSILNDTGGDQNILTASASGTTVANLDRSGNLAIEGAISDLSGATLSINDDALIQGGDLTLGQNGTDGTLTIYNELGGTDRSVIFQTSASQTQDTTYTLPVDDGSSNYVLVTDGSGVLSWISASGAAGAGDITAVGSMTSGDVFADSTADDDWLGLGASAGRIEFDDQSVDEVNILAAKLGVGTATPTSLVHVDGTITGKALTILNDTGSDQNILTASASGTTVANLDRSGNLAIEGAISDLSGAVLTVNDDLKVAGDDIIDSGDTTRISLGATTTLTNTTTTLSGTTTLTASSLATFTTAATLGMASTTTLNCGDCIDFDDMKDAMTLDASTSIGFGAGALNLTFTNDGSGNEIHNLSSTGDFIIQDNSTAFLTFKDDSTTDWVLPAGGDVAIDASTTASTVTTGVFDLNVNAGDAAVIAHNIDLIQNDGATAARDAVGQAINLTANDADGDVFGIKIIGNASTNATTGSYEAGISIDNIENTADSMTDAILITSSGINNGVTDAIDASAANITNALNVGQNFILGDGVREFSTGTGNWTLEDTSGNDLFAFNDAGTIKIGSSAVGTTAITLETDGTGDAEVVLPGQSVSASEILNDTITATQLSSTLTFADGDLIDFSAINNSGTGEGVRIPQATSCSSGTSNGQICWDNDTFALYVGNGSGVTLIGGTGGGDITAVGSMLTGDVFADSTADDDWLGLGSGAGRIEFDDQSVDEVNILSAKLGLGTATPTSLLHVSGTITGKALSIFDDTGTDQNIITASASGTTVANLDRSGNLSIEGYIEDLSGGTLAVNDDIQVNGNDILDSGANTRITLGATTTLTNTTTTLSGTTTVTASSLATFTTAATLGMASTTTLNCGDCIDFDDMKDAMTLDASTSIGFGAGALNLTFTNDGSGNEIHNLSSTGDFIVQDNSTAFLTFKDDSTTDWVLPVAGDVAIDASTTASTVTTGVFDLNVNAGDAAVIAHNIDLIQNDGATAARDAIGQKINLTANDADGDVFGLQISSNATANAAAGSYESLITLTNAEDTVGAVTDGLLITTTSGTAGDITDAIDVSAGDITNAINVGSNFILGNGIRQFSSSSTVWTVEDTGGNDLLTITDAGTTGNLVVTGTSSVNGNTTLGDANSDTLTINAGTSGTGITIADSSFANCTLTTVSNVLTCGSSSGMTSFTAAGDSGGGQAITNGNTLSILGGTNGIDTVDSVTDTVTINLDTTEIGTTTFNAGASDPVWTFNTSGATDPTLTFANNQITIGSAATLTATAVTTFNCTDCIDWDDISDGTTLDASTSIAQAGFDLNLTGNGRLGVGLASSANNGKFQVSDSGLTAIGKSLAIFDQYESQNIITASASGTTVANLDTSGNLAIEGSISDLSGATLSVNDNLDVSGTTGITLSGTGADLIFANSERITNDTNGQFNFGRNDAGTVTLTANDDDATAALTILPGGVAGLTLGGGSMTALTVTTDSTGDAEVSLPGQSIGASEILNDTITATQLAATLTFSNGDFLDLSAIDNNAASEGLKLPQNITASFASPGSAGFIAYDTTQNAPVYYNGSAWTNFSGASTTLQNAYDNDANGSDTLITLSANDDSLIFKNPSSSGTDSSFVLQLDQQNTTANIDTLNVTGSGLGSLIKADGASGGKAAMILNQTSTTQDILAASSSGTTKFRIDVNGAVTSAASSGTGLTFSDTGISTDIALQNGETIDNNVDGTISMNPTILALSGTTTLTASSLATFTTAATLGMASTTTLNCGDCIDFDDMKDAMTLDASTSIGFGAGALNLTFTNDGSGNEIHNLSSTGDFIIQDNSTAFLTFKDDSTTDWVLPAGGDVAIDASTTASTVTTGVFDLNVNAGDAAVIAHNIDLIQNDGATAARDAIAQAINLTGNDADGDVFGIKIIGNATANAAGGTYEAGISIDNAEDTAASMTDAILITSSGVNNGVTDALDVSAANINNAINVGGNFVLFDGIRSFGSSSGVLTLEDTSGNDFYTLTDNGTSATMAFTDTGFLDLAAITHGSSANQGLRLPQNTTLTNPTSGEGYLAWDTDDDQIKVYNGSSWQNISGASTTLQNAYDNDANGSDTLITLSANDDSLIFKNPSSSGTDSSFVLQLDQQNTTANIDTLSVTGSGLGSLINASGASGGKAAFILNQTSTTQDIIAASSSGTTKFRIDINGAITSAASSGTGLTFSNTGISSDIALQNGETIDNDVDGTISMNPTTFTLSGTTTLTASSLATFTTGATLGMASTTTLNCGDCIDFDDLKDAMTLDASTSIGFGAGALNLTFTNNGSGDEIHNLSSTGDFNIQDNGNSMATFADTSVMTFFPANATAANGQVSFDAAATDTTLATTSTGGVVQLIVDDAMADAASAVNQGMYIDYQVTGTADVNAMTHRAMRIDFTNSEADAADTTQVLSVNNANDASGALVDALISLENNDANTAVGAGIAFQTGGANSPDFTTGIDFSAATFTNDLKLQGGDLVTNGAAGTITLTPGSGTTETLAVATATTVTLFNTQATTINFGGAATTALNLGTGASAYTAINLGTGNGGNGINIGTGTGADTIAIGTGSTGADTITIGNNASTTALNFTSGTGAQTHTSSNASGTTTSSSFVFSDSALTVGTGLYVNETSTPVANTTTTQNLFNTTYAQGTSANTNGFVGLGLNFTDATTVAGNTEYAMQIQNQASSSSPTDNTIASLLRLDNADTATGNLIAVTDGLLITNSGAASAGIVNGITIGSGTQSITNGLKIGSTGVTTDIVLQNAETIDNDSDGTILLTAPTTSLSGDLTVTGNDITFGGLETISNQTANTIIFSSDQTSGVDSGVVRLPVKTDTGDPTNNNVEGNIYYNTFDNKFRCYQTSAWTDCIGSGGSTTLQGAYNNGSAGDQTITLSTANDSIIISNPTSSGSDSAFTFRINQQNTTAVQVALDVIQASNAANGASIVANAIDTETGLVLSTTAQTTGTGLSITGGGANLAAGGELLDLQMGAATAGNAINIVNSGAYTGTGLLNITANSLTTGTAINIPHTTSVIAAGGSLIRASSSSVDTSTTTGTLLDLSSTGSTAGTIATITNNTAVFTGISEAISMTGATSGTGLSITGGAANQTTTGELIDLVAGASTVGAGLRVTSTGTYTGTAATDGLINLTANGLTTGYGINIPHATSVIASGGSLFHISSSSVDTTTTSGSLLDLSSTGATAGTIALITNNTASFTGITESLSLTGQTTGTGLSITGGGANLATNGELIDLQMGAATAGNGINVTTSGSYTGTGLATLTANSLTTGKMLAISSSATSGITTAGSNVGSMLDITESGAMTLMTGSLASINASGTNTSGATGNALNINVAGTGQLMKALNIADASTGNLGTTAGSSGGILFAMTGAHTGYGFQVSDATATGTAMAMNVNSLTTGVGLNIAHTTSVIADTGSLARISSTSNDTGGATNGVLLDLSSTASTAGTQMLGTFSGLTTGVGEKLLANALTTGNLLSLTSSSTALVAGSSIANGGTTAGLLFNLSATGAATGITGNLATIDWSPGSSATSTGDLFHINIGTNGTIGNLFNITDAGTSDFSVSETQITSALPHQFTAPGDVSIAYDIQFTNQTASYIKSKAPLYIQTGESFESNPLTLQVYNSGRVNVDSTTTGGVTISSSLASVTPQSLLQVDGAYTGKALVTLNQTGDQDILAASTSGTTKFRIGNGGVLTLVDGETIDNTVADTIVLASNATNGAGVARLPVKTTTGDPSLNVEGNIYYNTFDNKFRCYQTSSWTDCIGSGGTTTLQGAYDNDTDTGDTTIQLSTADDSLIFTNPTSGGTDSSYILYLNQQHTTAGVTALDITQSSNAADGVNLTANSIDTENALDISVTALTSGSGVKITGSTPLTTNGELLDLNMGAATAGNGINIATTGVYTGTGLGVLTANSLSTGTLLSLASSGASQTSAKYIDISQTGVAAGFTGNLINLASSSTTGAATFIKLVADSSTVGIGESISMAGLTTGSGERITGSGATMATGGELLDLVLGANTVGAGITVTSTGTYTGVGAADGLINVTANGLTTGYGVNIPHTTSVIASGGSLFHISSSSVDTTTTSGALLDLASTGATAGTIALITNNTASFTGITESLSLTGQTTGTGLSITGGGANLATNGELIDLQMGAATAGNGINVTTSGSYTGTGLATLTANSLTTGKTLAINSSATSGITTAGSNTGSMLDITESGAMTLFTGSLASINASGANTSGATGSALNINIAGTGQLMQALNISDATTGSPTNGAVRINMTGAGHTGNAFQIDDTTATGKAQLITTNSLTTGTAFGIASSATSGITTAGSNIGSLFDITESGAMTLMTGNIASINLSGANTSGATGNAMNINIAGSGQIMELLNMTDATTGTLANGAVRLNMTGNHAGAAFQIDSATNQGTGRLIQLNNNSLQSNIMQQIKSSSTSANDAGSNLGIMLDITETGAMTSMIGSLASINASGANTVGSTGNAFNINVAGSGQIMKLLNMTDATTGALANGAVRLNMTGAHTGNAFQLDDVTATGNAMVINANSLTTGYALSLSSTSTALTTGRLLNLDWSPTTTTATGDLFRLNIGPNGNVANLFNVTDNGSTLFSVAENQITSAVPHQFTAAGDVSIAYDLVFTNQTSSLIDSNGPLTIRSGETFESNDLTLRSFNSGNIIIDLGSTAGKMSIGAAITPTSLLHVSDTSTATMGKALVILDQDETQEILSASASGTTKFQIENTGILTLTNLETIDNNTANGTVAVSTDSGQLKFDVNGWIETNLDNSIVSTAAVCSTTPVALQNTTNAILDDCTTSVTADYAEMYPAENGVDYGDIVVAGPNTIQSEHKAVDKNGAVISIGSYTLPKVTKATTAYDNKVIGIVSNNWSDFTSTGLMSVPESENPKPVALSGRVPVKVSSASDAIKQGDYITTSSEGGKAMKATQAGRVIGMALEDWRPTSGKDKVMVFVNNTWYEPSITLNSTGDMTLAKNSDGTYALSGTGASSVGTSGFGKVLAGEVDAGTIKTSQIALLDGETDLTINLATQSGFGKLLVKGDVEVDGTLTAENASISGELAANIIRADRIISPDLMTRTEIESLLANTSTTQPVASDAQNWPTNSTSSASLNELALENLFVTGTAAFDTVSIMRSATIGNDLVISSSVNAQGVTANSLDTLNSPLSIQSSASAPLLLMAGLVQIDTSGNVSIAGNLNVAGDITSSGLTLKESTSDAITGFGKLLSVIDLAGNRVAQITASGAAEFSRVTTDVLAVSADETATSSATLAGVVFTNNATAGSAKIAAGTGTVTIKNSKVGGKTLIFTTPTSLTAQSLFIKSQEDGEFVIGTAVPVIEEVKFNWWIVEVQ